MKKLTTEQIREIKGKMAELFLEKLKGQVLSDEEYQAGLKSGVPLICAPWNQENVEVNRQVWQNEQLRTVIRRECSICKCDISMAELNKDATFPICIDCFMEYHEELENEDKTDETTITGAE